MQLDQPLRVVTPTLDADVLSVLALATSSFSARRVHQLIGARSEPGVRRALDRLVDQGVVSVQRAGQAKLYELNRRHLAAPYIENLARLRSELVERLSERFSGWSPSPSFAALFGSAARGGTRPDSDIDLFIVRSRVVDADDPSWRSQVSALVEDVAAWTGNDARVLEMSDLEVRNALTHEDPVIVTIESEARALFGSLREVRLSRTRSVPRPTWRTRR